MITGWKIQQGPWGQSEEHKTWKLNYETEILEKLQVIENGCLRKGRFPLYCE